jgi:hypothetical protein
MNTPKLHADMIKAWADGYGIEAYNPERGQWISVPEPGWFDDIEYRVRPGEMERPKEPLFAEYVVRVEQDPLHLEFVDLFNQDDAENYNLRLLFCDDKLVDASVIATGESDEDSPW